MKYVISDNHGCYDEYKELLDKIHFSDEDELYILGDSMDRGPEPIKVLKDMMSRENVFNILGNHDFMMLMVLKKLAVEITERNVEEQIEREDLELYDMWMSDGGKNTSDQFRALTAKERVEILEYIKDSSVYETIQIGNKKYVLVHAGIEGFQDGKSLDDYHFTDFICTRADYSKRYFSEKNTYLVTGHTPTAFIREDKQPLIYEGNGHIALDCGCVYGGRLAAYCLDTGKVFYVDSKFHLK